MASITRVAFHVGGPDFHPVADQARLIAKWLGDGYDCGFYHDKEIFNHLEKVDLAVMMGLFYSGKTKCSPLTSAQEIAFENYVASGRPLLLHHGAVASYDDSETFKHLIGINWVWGGDRRTQHSPLGDYDVTHPTPRRGVPGIHGAIPSSCAGVMLRGQAGHRNLRPCAPPCVLPPATGKA